MMINIKLKKPVKEVNLNKVVRKAIEGYRNLHKGGAGVSVGGLPSKIPIEIIGPGKVPIEIETRNIVGYSRQPPEEAEKKGGISMTERVVFAGKKPEEVDLSGVNILYPLIPKKSRTPFAAANIKWSKADNALVYYVIEPELTQEEKDFLNKIKASLVEKLDIDFNTLRKEEAKDYLKKRFQEMVALMAKYLPQEKQDQLLYYVERDFIGFGKIEPFMQDGEIEDISCDGIGIPIYIYHREPTIGSVKTNIMFDSAEEVDTFVHKLAQRCGKTISVAQPLIGASLPDGSRLQATLGTDIAAKGSNFTIRKFTEEPLTPMHLLKFKTIDAKIAAFLWVATEYGRSILITGGVATGKTSMLNALSLFIKPELKVVTIEDTPELRLPHPHWIPQVARQPITEVEGKKLGEVDLFDLLRESLRQRPDYLIVGEVRGRETYVLFQQIATGHASMSTIHADSMERLVDRLTTPPISLPANLIEALDIVVFLVRIKYGNTYVRRVNSIYEIVGFDRVRNFPIVNEIFRWDPVTDTFRTPNPSIVLEKISKQYGISKEFLQREIAQRMKVLNWMADRGIDDYRDVARVIKIYYSRPEDLLASI